MSPASPHQCLVNEAVRCGQCNCPKPTADNYALGGKRVNKQWATALRAYHNWAIAAGTPTGFPPDAETAMNRICDFVYYLGPTANLMVKTCRKYVGSVLSSWRLVDSRIAPPVGAENFYGT